MALLKKGCPMYRHTMRDPRTDKLLPDCVTSRWVRAFADRWQVTLEERLIGTNIPMYKRRQIELEEKLIAYHLGCMQRQFHTGLVSEDTIQVLAPLHFVLNTTTGKSLGFGEQPHLEFTEMMDGARPITVLLRVAGGKDATVLNPLVIFQHTDRQYPIQGVSDDMPGVRYRTSPTGWVDPEVLASFFDDAPGKGEATDDGSKSILFVDPSVWLPFEKDLPGVMKDTTVDLRFLPKQSNSVSQPVEMGIRQKVKEAWSEGWQQMKKQMIDLGMWNEEGRDASGKMFNAGPRFFLKLAANVVQAVNAVKDANGMTLARKAMIQSGMATNGMGKWEIEQLHPDLAAIAIKYKQHFDGEVVTDEERPRPVVSQRQGEGDGDAVFPGDERDAQQDIDVPKVVDTHGNDRVGKVSVVEGQMNQQPEQLVETESRLMLSQPDGEDQASAIATAIAVRERDREELVGHAEPT
ncbi:unnamed protein product [Chondrus crispus]|uniref:DDE-1 domain-containing protein n=1 Tax=Chondrus crispus TaxID=2769 RepID=R7QKM6_CHOCR|nr:unnamed protein product [Chondrus crispus]CDF37950.1 unnamed protein product [Chondrus crispus]|eukprot:XP_005717819.1 unnamed protein product [Chondrus crispus]